MLMPSAPTRGLCGRASTAGSLRTEHVLTSAVWERCERVRMVTVCNACRCVWRIQPPPPPERKCTRPQFVCSVWCFVGLILVAPYRSQKTPLTTKYQSGIGSEPPNPTQPPLLSESFCTFPFSQLSPEETLDPSLVWLGT